MQKHVLLVGRSREVVKKAKALDLRYTLLLQLGPTRSAENLVPFHRVVGMPEAAAVSEWVAQAKLIHALDPFDALGAFTETAEEFAAAIAEELRLPYHSRDVIAKTHHKYSMRTALREAGLDDTGCRLLTDPGVQAVQDFGADYGYPIVLKPVNARGSLGVSLARSSNEIDAALTWFRTWAPGYDLLLEQFLDGNEWSVEGFSENGRHRIVCITEKFKHADTFIEQGHCVPAQVDTVTEAAIHALVTGALDALGIRFGPSHTEVIVTPNGPRIVETHVRLAGDHIPDLIGLVSGVNLHELWMRQTLGEPVLERIPDVPGSRFAAIRFVSPRAIGTIERVDGVAQARASAGVHAVEILQDVGARVGEVHDSFSRGASVIAEGATAEEANQRALEASRMVRFVVVCAE